MRTFGLRRGGLVAAATVASLVSLAAPAQATKSSPGAPHIGDIPIQRNLNVQSLAVDSHGGLHEIGTYQDFEIPKDLRPTYVTIPAGTHTPRYSTLRSKPLPFIDVDSAFVAPTVTGGGVDVVVSVCGGIYAQRTDAASRTVPTYTPASRAVTEHRCKTGGDGSDLSIDLLGIQPMAHGRLAVLMSDDPRHPHRAAAPSVYIGRPGHHFTQLTLPGAAATRDFAMTRDPANGRIYVAGIGAQDPANHVVPLQVWKLSFDRTTWTGPTTAAALPLANKYSGFASFTVTSVAVSHGHVWIGYDRLLPASKFGDFVVRGNAAGKWTPPQRLPGTVVHNGVDHVALAAVPGKIVRVWELDALAGPATRYADGDLEVRRAGATGHWSKAQRLTHGAHANGYALAARANGGFAYAYGGTVPG